MLVLTRRVGEELIIGHDGSIVVTVVEVSGEKVRIGISAPRDVPVDRKEVRERKETKGKSA